MYRSLAANGKSYRVETVASLNLPVFLMMSASLGPNQPLVPVASLAAPYNHMFVDIQSIPCLPICGLHISFISVYLHNIYR